MLKNLRQSSIVYFISSNVLILSFFSTPVAYGFNGSTTILVSQRFFSEAKLGKQNDFDTWPTLDFNLQFGVYEFSFGLEPIVQFGYVRNTAPLYALDPATGADLIQNGERVKSSDELQYEFFTTGIGARYKPWDYRTFVIVPYVEALMTHRYGRVKTAKAGRAEKAITGGDFGVQLGTGAIISFFFDPTLEADMRDTFLVKDFGLITSLRFLPAGFMKHGLAGVKTSGGWDFGLGLFADW